MLINRSEEKDDGRVCAQFFGFSRDESTEELRRRMESARANGFAILIASYKTHGMEQATFDKDYFHALDVLTEACRETGMKFFLEDYAPFPTGSANGAYQEKKNRDRGKFFLDERHMDVEGPETGTVIDVDRLQSAVYGNTAHLFNWVDPLQRRRMAVVAVRMRSNPASAAAPFLEEDSAICLDDKVENGFLKWDVPEGMWRVFTLYTTQESSGRPDYMNLLSRDSVALEIESVHRLLYGHLKNELGKTWIGFFYDEPEIGNDGGANVFDYFMLPGRRSVDLTDTNVYPWSQEMPDEMEKRDRDWMLKLPCLFYDGTTGFRDFRASYMDAVTSLVRENYNGQVMTFCRARGIRYIGHVVEDENCHDRLGCGPGHYFRQQYFQDEAGIDVIAGQILPGMDQAGSWYGAINADSEFYHYGLARLAASEAHINPLKKGRAFAECFAMYGYQSLQERKFLLDHLMVSGISRMLIAALPDFHNCPEEASKLISYADRVCELIRSSRAVIQTAVLYHAEAEWREGDQAQKFQKPARELARHQIGHDVIPADVFTFPERYNTQTEDGLIVNGNAYEALIIPACSALPASVATFVRKQAKRDFPIFFVDQIPKGLEDCVQESGNIHLTPLCRLAENIGKVISGDVKICSDQKKWIRMLDLKRNGEDFFLIHNEAPRKAADCTVTLRCEREIVWMEPFSGLFLIPEQERIDEKHIRVSLRLERNEMKILRGGKQPEALRIKEALPIKSKWTMEHIDGTGLTFSSDSFPDPGAWTGYNYSGKLVYRASVCADADLPVCLDLGEAADRCEVFLNGKSLGKRFAAPYLFDVRGVVQPGENNLIIENFASAGNRDTPVKFLGVPLDALTAAPHTPLRPTGVRGPIQWIRAE